MVKDEPRFSNDGKCPYCKSVHVMKGILSFGARVSSTPAYPKAIIQVWHCDDCSKKFNMVAE